MRQLELFPLPSLKQRARTWDLGAAWSNLAAITGLLCFQFALGLYASSLNSLFYARFGPFHDSVAYLNQLTELYMRAQQDGIWGALQGAFDSGSTVFLPWLIYAPISYLVGLQRSAGVWIQIIAATYMQLTLFFYYRLVRGWPAWVSLPLSAAFVMIAATFAFNGGLSDFRLDLLQYFLFTAMMTTYLIAHNRQTNGWWIAFGCTVGALCLGRATSPVYLALLVLVLLPFDLIHGAARWRAVLFRWMLAGLVTIAIAGMFYVTKFSVLYYYYFVWNIDANAQLPLYLSAAHLRFAFNHVGTPLLITMIIFSIAVVAVHVSATGLNAIRRINWRPLLFSAAPLGYLVFSGAGLNPFVSMTGIGGALFFLLDPISGRWPGAPRTLLLGLVACLCVGGLANASAGVANHRDDHRVATWIPRQAGLAELMRRITTAIPRDKSRLYQYALVHEGSVNRSVLFNTSVYDWHIAPASRRTLSIGKAQLESVPMPGFAVEVEWKQLPGSSDEERMSGLVDRVNAEADFFIMAADGTQLIESTYISRFVREINRRVLASGNWEQMGDVITICPIENVILMRNSRRP